MSKDRELASALAALNIGTDSGEQPGGSRPTATSTPVASPELKQVIMSLIKETLGGTEFIGEFLNKGRPSEMLEDVPFIGPLPGESEKLPDLTKLIREFSGNRTEFGSWKKNVSRIMSLYEGRENTNAYFLITLAIRNKITGEADAVLESYNTPLNWKAIAKCLTDQFADKRDLKTLEYQLFSMTQGRLTVAEFYQAVYYQLSLILNQISVQELKPDSVHALKQNYREKALDTFIRGLNGDLPRLLAIKEPRDLGHALHLCELVDNQEQRNAFTPKFRQHAPPVPPRQAQPPAFNRSIPRRLLTADSAGNWRVFNPRLYYSPAPQHTTDPRTTGNPQIWQTGAADQQKHGQRPQYPTNQNYQPARQFYPPPRPTAPKPQPKPLPMDIDGSIRSGNVNYMNRPNVNDFSGKRPAPLNGPPPKILRQFHIATGVPEEASEGVEGDLYYLDPEEQTYFASADSEGITGLYDQQSEENEPESESTPVDASDVHFLG